MISHHYRALLLLILSSLFFLGLGGCLLSAASNPPAAEEHLQVVVRDPDFVYCLEEVMLANGFRILERAADSSAYRYEVSWVVPTIEKKFWSRVTGVRYNGRVVAAHDSTGAWQIQAFFDGFSDAGRDSVAQSFRRWVTEPLQQKLTAGI